MSEERVEPKPIDLGEYKFGFHDDVEPVISTGKGLNEAVIRELSAAKNEPEWMLDFRLKSYEVFKKMPMQTWGPDLSEINFDDFRYSFYCKKIYYSTHAFFLKYGSVSFIPYLPYFLYLTHQT